MQTLASSGRRISAGTPTLRYGDDAFSIAHAGGGARFGVAHDRARLDVRAEPELDSHERHVLHGHHSRGIVLFASLRILVVHDGDGNHCRQRAMFRGNGFAHGGGGGRVLDLARLAVAKRESVGVASLGAKHVEAPWLGEAVIWRERRGGEDRLDLLARDGAIGESLDRASLADGVGSFHGRKLATGRGAAGRQRLTRKKLSRSGTHAYRRGFSIRQPSRNAEHSTCEPS